jgi:hypothetical protein
MWNQMDISFMTDFLGEALQCIRESSILRYRIKENSPITMIHTPVVCVLFQDIAESVITSTVL